MPIFGAHMSIAGGFYKAVEAAAACGMDCVQIFTASPQMWPAAAASRAEKAGSKPAAAATRNNDQPQAGPLAEEDVRRFQESLQSGGIAHPIAHDSYLINLASPDDALWKKSIDAYTEELRRAEQLGLDCVVTHPGAHTTSSEEEGIERVVAALDQVDRATRGLRVVTLLELTAGQGSCLGWKFEHLADILNKVRSPDRLGVCFDTCHVFAAGYPLSPKAEYLATMRSLDKLVDLQRVRAFHVNDSKGAIGSRVDRHEHIGRGKIGLEAFSLLVNDRRFRQTPMYLETRKELENGVEMDVVNLATLRGLVTKAGKKSTGKKSTCKRSPGAS